MRSNVTRHRKGSVRGLDPKGPLFAVITALGISVANSWAGYVVARRAQTKELNTFMGIVFGSFAVRGIIVITVAYLCLGVVMMDQVAFALAFSISAFSGLMVEVFFFHVSMETSKRRSRPNTNRPFKKKRTELVAACVAAA